MLLIKHICDKMSDYPYRFGGCLPSLILVWSLGAHSTPTQSSDVHGAPRRSTYHVTQYQENPEGISSPQTLYPLMYIFRMQPVILQTDKPNEMRTDSRGDQPTLNTARR